MIPLLYVEHRYGSAHANAYAFTMSPTTCSPPSMFLSNTACARARRCVARFEMMRRRTLPFPDEHSSIIGVTASAIVLTAFAPIASLQSTSKCTITISPSSVSSVLISISFVPPPNFTSIGSCSFARSIISCFLLRIFWRIAPASLTSTIWICPIMTGSSLDV